MATDGFVRMLEPALGSACAQCRAYMLTLASSAPKMLSQTIIARRLGYQDRQAMYRQLGAHGLPAPHVLTDWVRFLSFLFEYERNGVVLIRQAWSEGLDESVCYRTSYRVAHMSWRKSRALGSEHWITKLRREVFGGLRCTATEELANATKRLIVQPNPGAQ